MRFLRRRTQLSELDPAEQARPVNMFPAPVKKVRMGWLVGMSTDPPSTYADGGRVGCRSSTMT
jgi:hypothetical protein